MERQGEEKGRYRGGSEGDGCGRGVKGRWREGRYPNLHALILGGFPEHARYHQDELSLTSHFRTTV